jgi:hypothetical protein
MSTETTSKILSWLAKAGFPLEVTVGKACRAKGWLTYHSFPYSDPAEGKIRECDVFASRFAREHGSGTVAVDLAIECKRSPEHPWVIFGEPTKSHAWFLPCTLAPGLVADTALMLLSTRKPDPLDFLRPGAWVGYAVTKAHAGTKEGDASGAHSALRATMTAAEAFADRCERELEKHPTYPPHIDIVLPVLVVGAPLYLYTVDDSGSESLESISSAKITAPQRHFEDRTLLTIVSETAFPEWLDEVTAWVDGILPYLVPMASGIPKLVADARRAQALHQRDSPSTSVDERGA